MAVNISSVKTSSNGVWQGDNPLDYAFPLLIIQTVLIVSLCRVLAFVFKPLRQPKVIAEMVAGILLGPSALGRNEAYMHVIFPKWSAPILESLASIGLLYFLFLVGLELDLKSIRRSGHRALAIAVAGISLTFALGIGVAYVFRQAVDGADKVGFPQFLVFMGVALSITAFPVLARVLAELKLLTTRVGETAMAAAAINDVVAWISLALAVALAGNGDGPKKSPLIPIWVLLSGLVFVAFMMAVVKPAMKWVERRCSPEQDGGAGDEAYICLTLGGVLVAGLITDLIGIHAIFGAFVFGLTIPKRGDFAGRLVGRIEDFVSGLLLPLYFASSGLKTDVAKIAGGEAWGLLVLVVAVACAGKILGTFSVAMMCAIPARESLTLGVLMNTKGLVELIVLNIGREKKVLNDEAFAILVLMALFTTFLTTPTVMAIYRPARGFSATKHRRRKSISTDELRVLACVHGPGDIPSLIKLVESTRATQKSSRLKLYVMHLVELTERSSSIMMVRRWSKNGFPFINRLRRGAELHERVAAAFQADGQMGRVVIRPATAVSALATMHEDVLHMVEEKRAALIVLPFHKQWRRIEGEDEVEISAGHGWRGVNQRVLKEAPCSVAVLVDRGYGGDAAEIMPSPPTGTVGQNVCVIFVGGLDDREALELGGRMAVHTATKVTVVRFKEKDGVDNNGLPLMQSRKECKEGSFRLPNAFTNYLYEREYEESVVREFKARWEGRVEFIEKSAANIKEQVMTIATSGSFDLIVVGRVSPVVAGPMDHPELGPIGDMLASSAHGIVSSALVIGSKVPASQIPAAEDNDSAKCSEQISSAV